MVVPSGGRVHSCPEFAPLQPGHTHPQGRPPAWTEQRRPHAPDRTSQTTQRLLRVLDLLPPIAYWDTELCNRGANAAFAQLFGVSPQAIEGLHVREVLGPDLAELALPHLERTLATGEPQRFERTALDAHGVRSHAQVELFPDAVGGELRGVVSIDTDVTAHREAELSERQLEILRMVAQGLTNAQIAQRLYISETTVKWHIRQILGKTNSSNRAEAVAYVLGARDPDRRRPPRLRVAGLTGDN